MQEPELYRASIRKKISNSRVYEETLGVGVRYEKL